MKKNSELILHRKRLAFEKHWARYKYNVMERNYSYYKSISQAIGTGEKGPDEIAEALGDYLLKPIEKKAVMNTFSHVWGYFKNKASETEHKEVFSLLDQFQNDDLEGSVIKQYFLALAKKYQESYLLNSHYFDDLFMKDLSEYGQVLVDWFHEYQRPLIFRESKEPYKVWVSEIMCQQTQVATMLPYYDKFMKQWPDVYALAEADQDSVLKAWEGLGYYGRARRLLECAKVIVKDYGGQFPTDYNQLIKCPGIGPYTAGAILSICHNKQVTAVDGNVMRVISRVFNSHLDIVETATKKVIEKQVMEIMPTDASAFNQGLMELGALVCTPTNPKCEICPFSKACIAKGLGQENRLPVKSKAKKKSVEKLDAVLVNCGNKYMFVKTDGEGLLKGLWALPSTIGQTQEGAEALSWELHETYGIKATVNKQSFASHKHTFTHKIWLMNLYIATISKINEIEYPTTIWITKEEFDEIAVSTAYRKLLEDIFKD